jgi:hypothetical protein
MSADKKENLKRAMIPEQVDVIGCFLEFQAMALDIASDLVSFGFHKPEGILP